MEQDPIDRNVVVMFLDQMAEELDAEAQKEGQRAAPNQNITLGNYYGARFLRRAARAIERLPSIEEDKHPCCIAEAKAAADKCECEDHFTLTEQGRQALEEAELGLQED